MLLVFAFASPRDAQRFEDLYNTYKRLLYQQAVGVLQDAALAEDAVSEAMIRIYNNLHKIPDPPDNASVNFLIAIVRNVALTLLRKQSRHAADPIEDMVFEPAATFDLEDEVLARMAGEDVLRLLDGLSEDLRSVFILTYAHDLSHKEIAKALAITENNVTVRLHRARKKIQELLEKEGMVHA